MKILNLLKKQNSKLFGFGIILFLFGFNSVAGQNKFSFVRKLYFNNQEVPSVQLTIFPPGKVAFKIQLQKNYQLFSGTKIIIPAGVMIELQSPSGSVQQVKSVASGTAFEYKVDFTAQGENHTAKGYGGQIINYVTKAVGYNYRNTNEKGTTAASKGTVFTFTDYSQVNEKASISTKEGSIHIVDEVPVTVNGKPVENNRHGSPTTKSVSLTQSAGQAQYVSGNNSINYPSLDYAVKSILAEIQNEDDPEDLADDLMCLGDLYMDMDNPQAAIKYYAQAAAYYEEELGDDDMDTLEAKLSLAEAYIDAKNAAQGNQIALACIRILQNMLKEDTDDLAYLSQIRDQSGISTTCAEMVEICEYLGDAFALIGNKANSDFYYKKAESLCK